MAADFFIGESLVGDGNEVAHIDLIIGSKSGPAGPATGRHGDRAGEDGVAPVRRRRGQGLSVAAVACFPRRGAGCRPSTAFVPVRLIAEHDPRCVSSCCNSTAPGCRACSTGWWRTTAAPTT